MDIQRLLLIGVMATLSFMLLTEWVNFKAEQAPPPAIASQTLNTSSQQSVMSNGNAAMEIPSATSAPQVPSDELPSVVALEQTTETAPSGFTASANDIISINTDVLQLQIDLSGGDIIYSGLTEYHARIDTPEIPFVMLQRDEQRLYVAQSGLVGANGIDGQTRARFVAAQQNYNLALDQDSLQVDLIYAENDAVTVTKRFTLYRGEYLVDIEYLISNNSSARWEANLFGQIKRDSSDDPSADNSSGMGMMPFLGTALTQPDERFTKFDFEDMAESPFKKQLPGGWIAMIQHYFLTAWIPDPNLTHTYSTRVTRSGFNIGGFTSPALVIDPGETGVAKASFYVGPKDQYKLAEISEYLDLSVDYGWLWWIAQPLFWLLTKIHGLVGNWGVAIILLTVLIKAAFFQLSATSYRSMANMRRVQPKMVEIKERYGEDKQKQSQAMMELYKKEKINPLGGCLPILVQMPVFIALYWTLMESVELRQAPFYLWINDLSVMDPYFILPLIMGVSMWFQQKLNPPPPDPMQAKVMQWMPVIFTFFFLWFPAGLVLYWVANNLLSITQQYIITKQIEKGAAKA
ncbi:membrane protein insertase YidC [Halieaceae bacterium IMCC14734]|uniref:Membrane protein insertase YidC n=1 Tax=Candidatus Litorirhabdus singularis TaxID=2518993 RepID=A0ABT3TCE9_9GAMM|nr:membrane protein insertase YidC [Candidatus Litorirhabdus singularis]MCX2979973.1 membrane protein insertase YidC [Candidatus Litorirhabdus singularis]